MTREILLTQGKVALVDDEDYDFLMQWKWQAKHGSGTYYATKSRPCVAMHRLIMNAQEGEIIDHINHNGLDNRKENLRICTHKENCRNMKVKQNVSGYKGVTFNQHNKKWEPCLRVNNKRLYLGLFTDIIEAAYAHDEAAIYHYKEFACLNFPDLTSEDRNCSEDTIRRIKGLNVPINRSGKASKYYGLSHFTGDGSNKWMSRITINKTRLYLGLFSTEKEAALVYDENAEKYFGEFAKLNFPEYAENKEKLKEWLIYDQVMLRPV